MSVYFTVNTGQDIHLICESKEAHKVIEQLQKMKEVIQIIKNTPGIGTHLTTDHLW